MIASLLPRPILRAALAAGLTLALAPAAPLAAQTQPEGPSQPPATPAPSPVPAGPADPGAGVAIPPRSQPDPIPPVTAIPVIQPLPTPRESAPQARVRAPATTADPTPAPAPAPAPAPDAATAEGAPSPAASGELLPLPGATGTPAAPSGAAPGFGTSLETDTPMLGASVLPEWWWLAASALGALAVLAGGLRILRRRKPKPLRLAAPVEGRPATATDEEEQDPARLDLTLEITDATRSVMMFTLGYRLTIANRSDRAITDGNAALQLACARAGGGSGPSAGAAQGIETIARIGPQQARSLTGRMQLPLSAIQPLRQGTTPLFIPLVHVTFESKGQPAIIRSFVVGPRSASGRVHPIPLDQPPGGITGLVAQAVAIPTANAAA